MSNEIDRLNRQLVWLQVAVSVLLIANVAWAVWNFHRGNFVLGGISAGAALVTLVGLTR